MKKKDKINLRDLRKRKEKTLQEVSKELGIPYSTLHALETGMGSSFSSALKHHLSDYYGVNFFDAFPEEVEKLQSVMRRGYHFLSVIYEFVPSLTLTGEEKLDWIKTLNEMIPEELGNIIHTGQDEKTLREKMKKYIRKYSAKK